MKYQKGHITDISCPQLTEHEHVGWNGDYLLFESEHLSSIGLLLPDEQSAQHYVNADSGDSHPAENLTTPGVSPAQEGGR